MRSKTYVNEVDIRKLKVGQDVELGLDAFPEAKFSGTVTEVANIGEKKSNSDSKVFQIMIELKDSDSTYRPGMTTSNKVLTNLVEDVLIIPIEAVFSQNKVSFVYKKTNLAISKIEVKLGDRNNDQVIVVKGLSEGDTIYLNEPESAKEGEVKLLQ